MASEDGDKIDSPEESDESSEEMQAEPTSADPELASTFDKGVKQDDIETMEK